MKSYKVFFTHIRAMRFMIGFAGLAIVLLTVGASCFQKKLPPPEPITLVVWRSEDTTGALKTIAEEYTAAYPHVSFSFRTFKKEEYEDALFDAWAKGEGPDIFSVPNWRLGRFTELISPMPTSVQLTTSYVKKSFMKKELIVKANKIVFPSPVRLRDQFVDVVTSDVVFNDQIYGLPLSMDTIALFYNRDLLSKAQIAIPPTNWEEFKNAVQTIVKKDDEGKVVLPATALGTASNIPYFNDVLSAIMIQNGAVMAESGHTGFADEIENQRKPGIEALDFYTKFSNPTWKTYSWNDDQLDALEVFTQGNLAFYFGYHQDIPEIERRAPNLNFSYTKLPQLNADNPINIANYSVEAVYVKSKNSDHAWNFINFATGGEQVKTFIETTKRVPALLSLVAEKQEDPLMSVFATQALTAKSWYHGIDPNAMVTAFTDMVDAANKRESTLEEIVGIAASKVQLTLQKKD
ncbi:MAG TPA: extracellular solute-binding protein [Patescibacteria group bacterium]|nr:extracellular solute-binding protein [Patescibacteria group bacterium]